MLLELENKIDKLRLELESLLPMKQEDQNRLNKKIRLEFNYNSNHLEGNTLTYGETELLLYFGKSNGEHDKRELDEMEAHDVAFKLIQDWANDKERELNEVDIKQLNEIILVKPFWKEAITSDGQSTRRLIKVGDYKEFPNSVRLQNGEMFEYASPIDTPIKMKELFEWYNLNKEELHPIELASIFHHKFVLIHPFDDGNGRISRLVVNYILIKNNYPPIIIKSTDKKNYLFALNKADTGMMDDFISYMAKQLIWSLELNIKAGKGESIEDKDDWEKELDLISRKGNDKPQLRNSEITIERNIDSIYPLIDSINQIINSKIAPLFESASKMLKGIKIDNLFDQLGIEDLFLRQNAITESNQIIEYITIFKRFLKDDVNDFEIQISLIIEFKNYTYDVYFTNAEKRIILSKRISEPLTPTDIEYIVTEFGKKVTSMIKEKLGKQQI